MRSKLARQSLFHDHIRQSLVEPDVRMGMPLRGGIAFGDTIIDLDTLTFLGEPFVNAYLTETAQDWIGVALHHSASPGLASLEDIVAHAIPVKTMAWKLRSLLPSGMRRYVPSRTLKSALTHALCWHHYLQETEALERLEILERDASAKDRRKYSNTVEFLRAWPLDMPGDR